MYAYHMIITSNILQHRLSDWELGPARPNKQHKHTTFNELVYINTHT